MNDFNVLIQDNTATIFAGFALVIVLLGTVIALLWKTQRKEDRRWSKLLQGVEGQNLEYLLHEHLADRVSRESQIKEIFVRIGEAESKLEGTVRFIGVERYDAFNDTGGRQSFAVASVDQNGNGTVFSAVVGRTESRVYVKTILDGKPDRPLSEEELNALSNAFKPQAEEPIKNRRGMPFGPNGKSMR